MTPSDALSERLLALADGVTRIRAFHRRRPEVFTEDKSELAMRMRVLATDIRSAGRLPEKAVQLFVPTSITDRRGREIPVERCRRSV